MKTLKKVWDTSVMVLHKIEETALTILLSLMILLSFLQVLIRVFRIPHISLFETFDPMIKYSVLWVGFIAAGMATSKHKHIKIDLISKFLKGRTKSSLLVFTNLFASVVSFILCYSSILYITKIEIPSTDPAPFFNIPRWILLVIIPSGFGLISLRFFIKMVTKINNFIKKNEDEDTEDIELEH